MTKINDKTLLHLLKEQLKKKRNLEKENKQLLKEVKKLNQKLLESESFKSHFISNVTNEIINPFSSVKGLAERIIHLKAGEMKKAHSLAKLIYSESAFLDFQLMNIFMAAHLETGEVKMEISEFDIPHLINEIIEYLKPEIDKKKIAIETNYYPSLSEGEKLLFKTDREKLRFILVNLVSNAIKFSNDGSLVTIHIKTEGDNFEIKVQDEGIGISKENLNEIFDRFKRIDKKIHSLNPGNGLGLSIVDGLVDLMNGKIYIESEKGKGSIFTVVIPPATNSELLSDEDGLFIDDEEEKF